jgi:hypothetical protein
MTVTITRLDQSARKASLGCRIGRMVARLDPVLSLRAASLKICNKRSQETARAVDKLHNQSTINQFAALKSISQS